MSNSFKKPQKSPLEKVLYNKTRFTVKNEVIQAQQRKIFQLERENEKMRECLKSVIDDLEELKSWAKSLEK